MIAIPDLRIAKIQFMIELLASECKVLKIGPCNPSRNPENDRTYSTQMVIRDNTVIGYIVYRINRPDPRNNNVNRYPHLANIVVKDSSFEAIYKLDGLKNIDLYSCHQIANVIYAQCLLL